MKDFGIGEDLRRKNTNENGGRIFFFDKRPNTGGQSQARIQFFLVKKFEISYKTFKFVFDKQKHIFRKKHWKFFYEKKR